MKEFNFYDKREKLYADLTKGKITVFDFIVDNTKLDKELIKKLKDKLPYHLHYIIDKLAGQELVEDSKQNIQGGIN